MADRDDDPTTWPLTRVARAVRTREISSTELTKAYLARIAEDNDRTNAIVTLDEDAILAAARKADDAQAQDARAVGLLHGVPFTVKDAIETAGIRSTGGATELADYVPDADAPVVAALRRAGALVLGKTNCPTWCGDIQTHNPLFGVTNNPWDTSRTAGGSSGGSAAAVATGLTSFDVGTDIGGSIRIPSNYCGVYGHKPSYGLVSGQGYLSAPGSGQLEIDVNVLGPIARSVDDLELVMAVLITASPSGRAPVTLAPPRATALSGARLGVWLDDPFLPLAGDVRSCIEAALRTLTAHGARLEPAHPALDLGEVLELAQLVLASGGLIAGDAGVDGEGSVARTEDVERRWSRTRRSWAEWFVDYDALISPVMPVAAFPHDIDRPFATRQVEIDGTPRSHMDSTAWTQLVSVSCLPATVVPVGRTAAGLPVGIQIVGPHLEDRTTLAIARLIAEALRQG